MSNKNKKILLILKPNNNQFFPPSFFIYLFKPFKRLSVSRAKQQETQALACCAVYKEQAHGCFGNWRHKMTGFFSTAFNTRPLFRQTPSNLQRTKKTTSRLRRKTKFPVNSRPAMRSSTVSQLSILYCALASRVPSICTIIVNTFLFSLLPSVGASLGHAWEDGEAAPCRARQ